MSIEIPVRRIALHDATENPLSKGFILEFIVVDAFTVHTVLLTDKDPTLVATDYITIASEDFYRAGEVDEDSGDVIEASVEEFGAFAVRAYADSVEWALGEIVEFNAANSMVEALRAVLPAPFDR